MKTTRLSWKVVCALGLSLALLRCSKTSGGGGNNNHNGTLPTTATARPPVDTTVNLADVETSDGCLDLSKYFQYIASFDPQTPVFEVTTGLKFTSDKPIRPNFEQQMAYGNFAFGPEVFADLDELGSVTQTACTSLTFNNDGGSTDTYTIQPADAKTLLATKDDGQQIQYTWLSTKSMKIVTKSIAYDTPCTDGATPIFVEETKILDWSQTPVGNLDPATSPMAIDPDLLSLLASAVSGDPASLYQDIPADANGPERNLILGDRVRAMAEQAPRGDLLTCGFVSTPTPAPDPGVGPTPSPTDPSGGDTASPSPTPDPNAGATPTPTPTPSPTPSDGDGGDGGGGFPWWP